MKAIIILFIFILYLNLFINFTESKSLKALDKNQSKKLRNKRRNKILSQKNLNLNKKFLQEKSQEINDVNDDEKSDKDFSFEEILNKKG
jgi:hypothetical protein